MKLVRASASETTAKTRAHALKTVPIDSGVVTVKVSVNRTSVLVTWRIENAILICAVVK